MRMTSSSSSLVRRHRSSQTSKNNNITSPLSLQTRESTSVLSSGQQHQQQQQQQPISIAIVGAGYAGLVLANALQQYSSKANNETTPIINVTILEESTSVVDIVGDINLPHCKDILMQIGILQRNRDQVAESLFFHDTPQKDINNNDTLLSSSITSSKKTCNGDGNHCRTCQDDDKDSDNNNNNNNRKKKQSTNNDCYVPRVPLKKALRENLIHGTIQYGYRVVKMEQNHQQHKDNDVDTMKGVFLNCVRRTTTATTTTTTTRGGATITTVDSSKLENKEEEERKQQTRNKHPTESVVLGPSHLVVGADGVFSRIRKTSRQQNSLWKLPFLGLTSTPATASSSNNSNCTTTTTTTTTTSSSSSSSSGISSIEEPHNHHDNVALIGDARGSSFYGRFIWDLGMTRLRCGADVAMLDGLELATLIVRQIDNVMCTNKTATTTTTEAEKENRDEMNDWNNTRQRGGADMAINLGKFSYKEVQRREMVCGLKLVVCIFAMFVGFLWTFLLKR